MKHVCLVLILFFSFIDLTRAGLGPNLTIEEAQLRKGLISSLHYSLELDLSKNHMSYEGKTEIKFKLHSLTRSKNLRIDFSNGIIKSVRINENILSNTEFQYDQEALYLPIEFLSLGENSIKIDFAHEFVESGKGLFKIQDSEDKEYYVYSDLEPYGANNIFPCFDQPDLKASYELLIKVPHNWNVISNSQESTVTPVDENTALWKFPHSFIFSSYVFALHAGPFAFWKTFAGNIPLRLFARKSMAKYVDFEEWFHITKQGLHFYEEYFGVPYPFTKYDQIIVPNFGPGAMENVAAVTFGEPTIFRSVPTLDERINRADTILHEMAHMWFGDLVTMKWWNDLWLNESFATHMASVALSETKLFPNNELVHFSLMKRPAYFEDHLKSTHPIEATVPDTQNALSNFDNITYGKGASVLKILHHRLGDETFRKSLNYYFHKHAYHNTEVNDLIQAFEEVTGSNLKRFQHDWLQTQNHNRLKVNFACDNKLDKITITQTSPGLNNLPRQHSLRLGLYRKLPADKVEVDFFETEIDRESNTIDVSNHNFKCPEFIHLNADDLDFSIQEFNSSDISFLKESLKVIPSPLDRATIWYSLYRSLETLKIPPAAFIEISKDNYQVENISQISLDLTNYMMGSRYQDLSVIRMLKESEKRNLVDQWSAIAKERTIQGNGTDKSFWMAQYVSLVHPENGPELNALSKLLDSNDLDIDIRWTVLMTLARAGKIGIDEVQKEVLKDPTDSGFVWAFKVLASRPDLNFEEELMSLYSKKIEIEHASVDFLRLNSDSFRLGSSMGSFFHVTQEEKTKYFANKVIESFATLPSTAGENYLWNAGFLFPSSCDKKIIQSVEEKLELAESTMFPVLYDDFERSLEIDKVCAEIKEKWN